MYELEEAINGEIDDVEITIKKFPVKDVYTDGGEYSWEEAVEADIEENYNNLSFEGSHKNDIIDLNYYIGDNTSGQLEQFLKDYKIKY